MGARYKAKCDRCHYRGLLDDVLRSYELAEHVTLNVKRGAAWCPRCQAVIWAEVIPSLPDIERRIAECERRDPSVIETALPSVNRLEELRRRADWLKTRTTPARCLECGTTDVTAMTTGHSRSGNEKWTLSPHPNCGGTISVFSEPTLSLDRRWTRYTPDGLRIGDYSMSPSKGAVFQRPNTH